MVTGVGDGVWADGDVGIDAACVPNRSVTEIQSIGADADAVLIPVLKRVTW